MGVSEINDFITYLVHPKTVSASTQNQAISAVLFLYRNVLGIQLNEKALMPFRSQKPNRLGYLPREHPDEGGWAGLGDS